MCIASGSPCRTIFSKPVIRLMRISSTKTYPAISNTEDKCRNQNVEKMSNAEIKTPKHQSLFLLRKMAEKIRFNSCASRQSGRAPSLKSGTAAASIRNQCFVSRLPLAEANSVTKLLLRPGVVRLTVICAHARAGIDELGNQRCCHGGYWNALRKCDDCLSEPARTLFKIIRPRRRPVALFAFDILPSSFIRHFVFAFFSRHSSFPPSAAGTYPCRPPPG